MKSLCTFFCMIAMPACLQAINLTEIADKLEATEQYADSCSYEVWLPAFSDPINYTIALESYPTAPNDTLSPCDYLITWKLRTPNGQSEGFSAYFDGSHFRYRDERLQEYHADWDVSPFSPSGRTDRGVQRQAQFTDLLPSFIGMKFREMSTDSDYIYRINENAIVNGRKTVAIKGVRRVNGIDASEFTYNLQPDTYLPLRIDLENNPGQLGEQSITINFSGMPGVPAFPVLDLGTLASRKNEEFRFRESSFSLENLPGQLLPEINAPKTTGERYYHARGTEFSAPTVIVFLDAGVGSTPGLIEDVRAAIDNIPMQTDVVWAFINHRIDDIDSVMPTSRPGETVLMNSGASAMRCGIGALTPVIIYVNRSGRVSDITNGYNQDLSSVVIQKVSLLCN